VNPSLWDQQYLKEVFGPALHLLQGRELPRIFQEIEGLTPSALESYIRTAFPRADGAEFKQLRHGLQRLERELPPTEGLEF
jgi:hypothetical protein